MFLVGHSLGTSIIEYYLGEIPVFLVKALGVYGPHIDVPSVTKESLLVMICTRSLRGVPQLGCKRQGRQDQTSAIPGRQSDHHLCRNISQLPRRRDQQSCGRTDDRADNLHGKNLSLDGQPSPPGSKKVRSIALEPISSRFLLTPATPLSRLISS